MKYLKLKINAVSPIIVAKNTGDANMISSEDFISGSIIRGLFASEFIKRNNIQEPHKNEDFYDFFLNNKLIFSNAFLTKRDNSNEFLFQKNPLSLLKDKHDKEMAEVFNYLVYESDSDSSVQHKKVDALVYLKQGSSKHTKIHKGINYHHARNRYKGSAEESKFFNYESINKDTKFTSFIYGDDELVSKFSQLLGDINTGFIGKSKNAQYGKVSLNLTTVDKLPEELFNAKSKNSSVHLVLQSDTIVYNNKGFSSVQLADLENHLKSLISDEIKIDCKLSFVTSKNVETYLSVWKMKRNSETAFAAGSVISLNNVSEDDFEKLKELQIIGIGERTNEGFGKLIINLIEDNDEISISKYETKTIADYSLSLSEETKELLKSLIEKKFIESAANSAFEFINDDSKKELKKITKTQIGKLEHIIKNSDNITKFREQISKYNKNAKDKLENIRFAGNTFWTFLTEKKFDFNEILSEKSMENLTKLVKDSNYDTSNTIELVDQYAKEFYLTLFTAIRKVNKKEGEK